MQTSVIEGAINRLTAATLTLAVVRRMADGKSGAAARESVQYQYGQMMEFVLHGDDD